MAKTRITSSVEKKENKNHAIIGTFEGKSGDGTVVNENGIEIGTEVWETIFDSDEFKDNLKNGFYIGFLGHPEDPGCQDFKDACIILRDAYIDNNGEVFAKCDLVDTPVGRIVKTFIDAGVNFGLSVRGAGTITGSRVEPDDFVFRGFDLVAFPAYKDAIPEFKAIAASTNLKQRRKYMKICASVEKEIPEINDINTLKNIQSEFDEDSNTYRDIQNKVDEIELENEDVQPCIDSVKNQKFEAVMALYLDALAQIRDLTNQIAELNGKLEEKNNMICEKDRMFTASTDLYNKQMKDMDSNCNSLQANIQDVNAKYKKAIHASQDLKKDISKLKATNKSLEKENKVLASKNEEIQKENEKITASEKITKKSLEKVKNSNLNYIEKAKTSDDQIVEQETQISSLKAKVNETVNHNKNLEKQLSDLDKEKRELESDVKSALDLVADYQNAYAEIYASIVGVNINGLSIDNLTSVSELKHSIMSSTSTSNMPVKPSYTNLDDFDEDIDEVEDVDDSDDDFYDAELTTL